MIKTVLLRNTETGDMAMRMTTLGVDIVWRVPIEAHELEPKYLQYYLVNDFLPKMEAEVMRLKKETKERLRKKHGKKEKPGKKLKENKQENDPQTTA